MRDCKTVYLLFALATLFTAPPLLQAKKRPVGEPALQMCSEYSGAGDLLTANVLAHSFVVSITRQTGQVSDVTEHLPENMTISQLASSVIPCRLTVSAASDRAALVIPSVDGVVLELIDLTAGKPTHMVRVPNQGPVQSSVQTVGFVDNSNQLAASQVHYLETGEPEVATVLIDPDGSISSVPHNVLGPRYTEVSASSFDFRGGRVWFLCPGYPDRIDRQPRCTLTSARLLEVSGPDLEIPPPPDDRVIGSGQPNLGFPSPDEVILLAERRVWLYRFSNRAYYQMNLPETPHHILWFEFPGQPSFSSDGRFAAIPVYMFHNPLFQEGQVSHGTKVVLIELPALRIIKTIQPPDGNHLVDVALHSDGVVLKLVASWGNGWKSFQVRVGSDRASAGADTTTPKN